MGDLCDELDHMCTEPSAMMLNRLNILSGAEQHQRLQQEYRSGTPNHRHIGGLMSGGNQVLSHSKNFQAAHRSDRNHPEGAAGPRPHQKGQGLRGWMQGYGSKGSQDEASGLSGYDMNVYGTVIGFDKAFGGVLFGVAGGYANSGIDQDNGDRSDADTAYGMLYASFGSSDWFGDINLGYGRSGIDYTSAAGFGSEADINADNYSAFIGGGKQMAVADGKLLITPAASLLLGYYDQAPYTETSAGIGKDVDPYDRWSCQSSLGAALAMPLQAGNTVFTPELRARWLHEFNADEDLIGYRLIGGTGQYAFTVQGLDEDLMEVGFGLGAMINNRLEIVLDVDGRFSSNYEALLCSGRIAYTF